MVSWILEAASNKLGKGCLNPGQKCPDFPAPTTPRPQAPAEQSPAFVERALGSLVQLWFGSCWMVSHDTEIKRLRRPWSQTRIPRRVAELQTPAGTTAKQALSPPPGAGLSHFLLAVAVQDHSAEARRNKKPPQPRACVPLFPSAQRRARGLSFLRHGQGLSRLLQPSPALQVLSPSRGVRSVRLEFCGCDKAQPDSRPLGRSRKI